MLNMYLGVRSTLEQPASRISVMIATAQYSRGQVTTCSIVNMYKADPSRCLLSCALAGVSSHCKSHHCFEEVLFISIPGILQRKMENN